MIAAQTATVAASSVVALDDIMAAYHLSVLAYNSASRPDLKFQVRVRHPSGKIERSFYKTRAEADAELSAKKVELENIGIEALNIDSRTRLEVVASLEKLKPFEVTLTKAVDFFVEHHRASCTVREACELYLASRKGKHWSARHKRNLKGIIARFTEKFGDKVVSHLKVEELEQWFDALGVGASSVNSYRRLLHSVMKLPVDRGLAKVNPIKAVEKLEEKAAPVGILTPAQMKALLIAAKSEPDVLMTVAIGGFAGVRPEEIARLRWCDLDLEHGKIDISAENSKTGKHRYVKIEDALRLWFEDIEPALTGIDSKELIQRDNFRRRFENVRWAAGFYSAGNHILKPNKNKEETATPEEVEAVAKTKINWPHDALRHSFGSYHLAHFNDPGRTALEMGHTTTKMLFKHYRVRVSEKDAAAWWKVLPPGCEAIQQEAA